jgi:hypothetical protein
MVGQVYSEDDQILECSVGHFVPGHFKFHVLRRVERT